MNNLTGITINLTHIFVLCRVGKMEVDNVRAIVISICGNVEITLTIYTILVGRKLFVLVISYGSCAFIRGFIY